MCALFSDLDEELSLLLPFMEAGLRGEDRVLSISSGARRERLHQQLDQAGLEVTELRQRGQLMTWSWDDRDLFGQRFDREKMLELLWSALDRGPAEGYHRTRVVADMDWAVGDLPSVQDLMKYEARLDRLLSRYEDPVVCAYDSRQFAGRVIVNVLRTHPLVVVGGALRENPFHAPPEAFLKELDSHES